MGYFPDFIDHDFSNVKSDIFAPPTRLQPRYLYNVSKPDLAYTARHSSDVHIVFLAGVDLHGRQLTGVDLALLFDMCPNLTYLGLQCGENWKQLESLPSRLKTVALGFDHEVDMVRVAQGLKAWRTRCHNLSVVAIFVNITHTYYRRSKVVEPLKPVLEVLHDFREEGLDVAVFINLSPYQRTGWGPSSDEDSDSGRDLCGMEAESSSEDEDSLMGDDDWEH